MFGLACGRCWDRDCNCTVQELEEYKIRCEENRKNPIPIEYSKTQPAVAWGDVIHKDGKNWYVVDVKGGIAYVDSYTNVAEDMVFGVELKEPYQKFESHGVEI